MSTPSVQAAAIERRSLGCLRPYRGNARTHSKKQIRQIADSIRRFGFTSPVLISDDDEIIAGHGRVEASRLLGMESVPTLRLSPMPSRIARGEGMSCLTPLAARAPP